MKTSEALSSFVVGESKMHMRIEFCLPDKKEARKKKQKRKVCREHQIPKTAHLSNCIFLNNKHNQVLLKSVSQSLFLTLLLEAH